MNDPKRDDVAGRSGSALSDVLGLSAMLPVAHVQRMGSYQGIPALGCLLSIEAERRLRVNDPLYDRAAFDRVLAHARAVHETSEHMHARNDELRLMLSDMSSLMLRMVAGIEHLAEIARQWEPDHSSGADRRGWLLAQDAKDDAKKLLAELPGRIHRPNVVAERPSREER